MHSLRSLFGIIFAGVAIGIATAAPYSNERILVKFKPGTIDGIRTANAMIGASIYWDMRQIGWMSIKLPKSLGAVDAVKYYSGLASVEKAELNYLRFATFTPNDPKLPQQYGPQKTQCLAAWDLNKGSSSTVIAIVDTGVDYNHPELSGKVIKGKDFINNDDDPMDDNGHGTHCSGIAAAKTNNGVGVAGAGFNCTILAEKVLSGGGGGSADTVTSGILDAIDKGANVISMSLGGSGFTDAEQAAVDLAWTKNVVVVAAAGNNGVTDKFYPAGFEHCIAVAATDRNDQKADFSNYGADWVDVAAPGVDILSTLPGNNYGVESGTSMACPLVAGITGLVRAYGPQLTNVQVRNIIESTCDNVGTFVAFGRVNAFQALKKVVIPIQISFPTTAISPYQASLIAGGLAAVQKTDASYYVLRGTDQGQVGQVSGAQFDVAFTKPLANYLSGSLVLNSKVNYACTLTLWFWNYNTRAWDMIRSYPVGTSNTLITVTLPGAADLAKYVSGGSLKVIARALKPARLTKSTPLLGYWIDLAKVEGQYKPDDS